MRPAKNGKTRLTANKRTAMVPNTSNEIERQRAKAQSGFSDIKESILDLLNANEQGLGNSEIAELLGLRTGLDGRQKDYLTWSILQDLCHQKLVHRIPRPNSKRQQLYQSNPQQ
jgi:hypothetical protein